MKYKYTSGTDTSPSWELLEMLSHDILSQSFFALTEEVTFVCEPCLLIAKCRENHFVIIGFNHQKLDNKTIRFGSMPTCIV